MARMLFVPASKTRLRLSSGALHSQGRRRGFCRLILDVLRLPTAEDDPPQDPTEDPNRPWAFPE